MKLWTRHITRHIPTLIWLLFAAVIISIYAIPANATTKTTPKPTQAQSQQQQQQQAQDQDQAQNQSQNASSEASASNAGNTLDLDGDQFYALSLMFPQASGCFTGVQGGAQEDNTSGFLGIHLLNKSCWYDKLAGAEQDIEINARLKCADRKYRNALAYDRPGKERQAACIAMKVASGKDQVRHLREQLAFIENEQKIERDKCNEAKNKMAEDWKESAERINESCQRK